MDLEKNITTIFQQVDKAMQAAGREDSVSVIAVTKYVDADIAKELVDKGVTHIGENRRYIFF